MLHIVNRIFHPRPQAYLGKTRGSSKHRRREREPFIAQSNTLKLHEIVTSDLKTIFSYGAKSFSFFYQQHLLEMGKSSVSPVLRDPSSTNLQEHAQKSQWDRQAPTSAAWQLQEFVFLFINKKWGFFFYFLFFLQFSFVKKACKHLINSDGVVFLAGCIAEHVLSTDEVQEITFCNSSGVF